MQKLHFFGLVRRMFYSVAACVTLAEVICAKAAQLSLVSQANRKKNLKQCIVLVHISEPLCH